MRLVSATDSDLEGEMAGRAFSEPLFHRLAGFQIVLPPLRQRREDIGELLVHFLGNELATVGALDRLEPPSPTHGPGCRLPRWPAWRWRPGQATCAPCGTPSASW